ncbi:MAG: phosphate acetyltransferase [Gemmatimonadota bacterium]
MRAFLKQIQERAAATPRRIVFSEARDERIKAAVQQLKARHLVQPIVLEESADDARLEQYAETFHMLRKSKGVSYDAARSTMRDPLYFAAMMVRHGDADGSVAGAVRTSADVLRAALLCVGVAPGIKCVSSAFYMVVPDWPEVLTFTDAGVVPAPSAQQLADIAEAAAIARTKIVGDEPRVAFLSFSTLGSAETAATLRVRAAVATFRERFPDIVADGELQADAALVAHIAQRKAPDSPVAGRANILVFPSLDAGNIGYKLVQRLARAEAIGPILQGLAKPCNDLSRGASVDDILNVACITSLQAGPGREQNLPSAGAAVRN